MWHAIWALVFTVLLIGLTFTLVAGPVASAVKGFITVGAALGALAGSADSVGYCLAQVGCGLINVGVALLLLAPFYLLLKKLWIKLKNFM